MSGHPSPQSACAQGAAASSVGGGAGLCAWAPLLFPIPDPKSSDAPPLAPRSCSEHVPRMESPSDKAPASPAAPTAGETGAASQRRSSGKQPMSATLRERLKKTRSSFNSCYALAKRLKVDTEENNTTTDRSCSGSSENCKNMENAAEESPCLKDPLKDVDVSRSESLEISSLPDNLPVVSEGHHIGKKELLEEKMELLKQVQEKEELLRRLKLTKMYRSKNDLSQLQSLIKKWRNSSQLLLFELQSTLSMENKKVSLTQLIDIYGLEDKLLHYNRIEEEFTDV